MSVFPTRAYGCQDPDIRLHFKPNNYCQNSHLKPGRYRPLFPIVSRDFSALLSRRSQVRLLLGGQFGEISTVWIDPIVVEIDDT